MDSVGTVRTVGKETT